MPLFPDSDSSPSVQSFAVYALGGSITLCLLYTAYQRFVPPQIQDKPIPADPKSGLGLIAAGIILGYATHKFAQWTNNSEY